MRESISSQYTAWDYHQMGLVATLELDPATQDNTTAWQVSTETRMSVLGLEQICRRCLTMLLTHLLIFAAVPAHGPGGGAAPGPRAQLPRVESGQGAGQAAAGHG